jgi:hypothetical protein
MKGRFIAPSPSAACGRWPAAPVWPMCRHRCRSAAWATRRSASCAACSTSSKGRVRHRRRPSGRQARSAAKRRGQPAPLREQPPSARTVGVPAAPRDLAWVGQIERWLIPVLLVVVGLLLAGLGVLALRSRRPHRDGADTGTGVGRLLLQLFAAAVIAVPLGYQVAGVAFQRIFSSFNNHDTAANHAYRRPPQRASDQLLGFRRPFG